MPSYRIPISALAILVFGGGLQGCGDPCADEPCHASAHCRVADGEATCACPEDRQGPHCQQCRNGLQDRNGDGQCARSCVEESCSGQGDCDDATGAVVCACFAGYQGAQCELREGILTSTAEAEGLLPDELERLLQEARAEGSDAIILMRGGKLVREWYSDHYLVMAQQLGFSVDTPGDATSPCHPHLRSTPCWPKNGPRPWPWIYHCSSRNPDPRQSAVAATCM